MICHRDETTKPSRINRRRKKRWKISDLIANGLTDCACMAILFTSISRSAGRGNPFSIGVKTPQPYVAFLCASFSAAFCCVYTVMAGCLGSLRAGRSNTRYFHPTQPVAHAVESIGGGYSSLVLESPL